MTGLPTQAIDALLAAFSVRDPNARVDAAQVTALAVRVAQRLGLDRAQVDEVRAVAALHDVGMLGLPGNLRSKREALTEAERATH